MRPTYLGRLLEWIVRIRVTHTLAHGRHGKPALYSLKLTAIEFAGAASNADQAGRAGVAGSQAVQARIVGVDRACESLGAIVGEARGSHCRHKQRKIVKL